MEELNKLMFIATSYEDPKGDRKKTADTKRRAGLSAVYDLKEAGESDRLWGMQTDQRLEKEVRIEAGLAAVDVLVRGGKSIKLMHLRNCSPFPDVNFAIREEIVLDELKGKDLKSWEKEHYYRFRMAQLRPPARQPIPRAVARA